MKYFAFLFLLLGLPLLALAQDTGFVSLTNIPAITEVGNAITTPEGLSIFLNNIYRLAIGIAAVVAVLQIMRAGIMYMGGDSVTEKKEAKNLIALSIGGLILVLSPVVVFSIINPEILSLKIGGLDELHATSTRTSASVDDDGGPEGPTAPPPTLPGGEEHGTCKRYANGQAIPASDTTGEQCCGIQSNQNVQCSVNWNYSSQPYVKFCGCQFRGALASPTRYQVWRLQTEEGGLTQPRMMPKYRTAVEQYEKVCRDNGGAVEDKFIGFLERSVACDEDSGLPTPEEGDRYVCQNKEMTCK